LVQNLDFDFEKCCSVTLSSHNVYACLVCGKYFQVRILNLGGKHLRCLLGVLQGRDHITRSPASKVCLQGRGPSTEAYTHALEAGHHMFMKVESGRVYCLPDMYEVQDRSLADIQYVLNPTFTGVWHAGAMRVECLPCCRFMPAANSSSTGLMGARQCGTDVRHAIPCDGGVKLCCHWLG
jgi:hypothetical protein